MRFADRRAAGQALAEVVCSLNLVSPVVLGLPRGGVPVAAQIAVSLDAPLDVIVARKVGAPDNAECGIAAVAEGLDDPVVTEGAWRAGVGGQEMARLAGLARAEIARQVARYRDGRPLPELRGRDVVVVDDGVATGISAEAALRCVRRSAPRRVVLAVPVCARDSAHRLRLIADEVVAVTFPSDLRAVGFWYDDFTQTRDDEVIDLLARQRLVVGWAPPT